MPPDWPMAGPFSTAITTLLASARDCRRAASFGVPSTTPRSCPSPEMSRSPTTISGCLCRHEHNCWLPIGPCAFWSTGVLLRGAYSEIAGCPSAHACACSGTAWMAAGSESLDAPVSCVVGGFGGHLRLLANWRPRERGASQIMPGVANPARAGWSPGSGRLTLPPCLRRWDLGGYSVVFAVGASSPRGSGRPSFLPCAFATASPALPDHALLLLGKYSGHPPRPQPRDGASGK